MGAVLNTAPVRVTGVPVPGPVRASCVAVGFMFWKVTVPEKAGMLAVAVTASRVLSKTIGERTARSPEVRRRFVDDTVVAGLLIVSAPRTTTSLPSASESVLPGEMARSWKPLVPAPLPGVAKLRARVADPSTVVWPAVGW